MVLLNHQIMTMADIDLLSDWHDVFQNLYPQQDEEDDDQPVSQLLRAPLPSCSCLRIQNLSL